MKKLWYLLVFLLCLVWTEAYAQTQTPLTVVDGTGARQTLCDYTSGNGNLIACNTPLFFNGSGFGPQPADGGYRPFVNIYSLPSLVGDFGHFSYQSGQVLTVQNLSYSAGMSEGGLLKFQIARLSGGSGTLTGLRIKSNAGSANVVWIYAWSKTPVSACTDHTAFTPSALDNAYALPGFPVGLTLSGSPGSWDAATYIQDTGLNIQYQNQDPGGTNYIYFCLVTGTLITPPSATDLSMVVTALAD